MTTVLVVPGRRYGPGTALLMFAAVAAMRRGAATRDVYWPAEIPSGAGLADWVRAQVEPIADDAAPDLVVGKSLGTLAAGIAAARGIPAIWMTPLLGVPEVVAALRAATAPVLLVGGEADTDSWDPGLARELTPHVLSVPGADHGMLVPGPLADSAAVLGQVAVAVERFLDDIAWPTTVAT